MIPHQLFCDTDDFCQHYLPEWKQTQLQTSEQKRNRSKCLCESEIMTSVVYFQISEYRTFKHFYFRHVLVHWQSQFPRLPSYKHFVELMAEILNPLVAFMHRVGLHTKFPEQNACHIIVTPARFFPSCADTVS